MKPKQSRTWVITDTHFNHSALVELCGRPTNHTELILKNWRHLLSPADITIHLGDVILGRNSELKGMLDSVPGKKFLVLGNHDRQSKPWYMRNGFDFVGDGLQWGNIYFSHKPTKTLPTNCIVNWHGHFHNSNHHRYDCPTYNHCRLLAIEYTNYSPVLLSQLVATPFDDKPVESAEFLRVAPEVEIRYN